MDSLCKNRVSEVWIKIIFKEVEEVSSSISSWGAIQGGKVTSSFFISIIEEEARIAI